MKTIFSVVACASLLALLSGCATPPPAFDYTAFNNAKPVTLLVMPPLNDSPDVKATAGVWAQATQPLAEAGYYVLPVSLVDEMFKQNGVTTARDAQDLPVTRLREVFGADAAVYIRVKKYGTSYAVIRSETRVEVEARIVDLRTEALLWQGTAVATSAEQQQAQGGLIAALVVAAVQQIIGSATDAAYGFAGIANQRLLAPRMNGVLPGPRSPQYGQPIARQ
jgi:hypothetical protein